MYEFVRQSMLSVMEESTKRLLEEWGDQIQMAAGRCEILVEKGIAKNPVEIIAKTSFVISEEKGK